MRKNTEPEDDWRKKLKPKQKQDIFRFCQTFVNRKLVEILSKNDSFGKFMKKRLEENLYKSKLALNVTKSIVEYFFTTSTSVVVFVKSVQNLLSKSVKGSKPVEKSESNGIQLLEMNDKLFLKYLNTALLEINLDYFKSQKSEIQFMLNMFDERILKIQNELNNKNLQNEKRENLMNAITNLQKKKNAFHKVTQILEICDRKSDNEGGAKILENYTNLNMISNLETLRTHLDAFLQRRKKQGKTKKVENKNDEVHQKRITQTTIKEEKPKLNKPTKIPTSNKKAVLKPEATKKEEIKIVEKNHQQKNLGLEKIGIRKQKVGENLIKTTEEFQKYSDNIMNSQDEIMFGKDVGFFDIDDIDLSIAEKKCIDFFSNFPNDEFEMLSSKSRSSDTSFRSTLQEDGEFKEKNLLKKRKRVFVNKDDFSILTIVPARKKQKVDGKNPLQNIFQVFPKEDLDDTERTFPLESKVYRK